MNRANGRAAAAFCGWVRPNTSIVKVEHFRCVATLPWTQHIQSSFELPRAYFPLVSLFR